MSNKDKSIAKAMRYYRQGNYEKSVYWYSIAIESDPEDAELFAERGVAQFHMGLLQAALDDLNRAAEIEPANAYRYASRAYVRDFMGDVQGAVDDYHIAIKLDPDDAVAHNNLGLLEEKLGRHRQAKAFFELADAIDDRSQNGMSQTDSGARPENVQLEIDRSRRSKSIWKEAGKVFTDRAALSDFITFIRNGFK